MCKFYKNGFEVTIDIIAMILGTLVLGLIIGIITLLFIDNTINDLLALRYLLYLFAGLTTFVYFVNIPQDLIHGIKKEIT